VAEIESAEILEAVDFRRQFGEGVAGEDERGELGLLEDVTGDAAQVLVPEVEGLGHGEDLHISIADFTSL